MMYDITFCNDDKCIHTECERHLKNVPKDTPVSVGVWATCEHYLEGDNEKRWRRNEYYIDTSTTRRFRT